MSSSGEIVVEALNNVTTKHICEICGEEHDSEQQAAKCAVNCRENPYIFKSSEGLRHSKNASIF